MAPAGRSKDGERGDRDNDKLGVTTSAALAHLAIRHPVIASAPV